MQSNVPSAVFPVFFVIWAVLAVAFGAFFHLSPNAALKRKVFPVVSVVAGALFIGFAWKMGAPGGMLLFMIPFVALITLINMRVMKFCDACGKTVRTQNPFSPPKFCSKCGAPLIK